MLSSVLYWLVNMSILGSFAGCIIWLTGRIRQIPRRVACLLWSIPLLRLWIPVALRGRLGLMRLVFRYAARTMEITEHITVANVVQQADTYFPVMRFETANLERIWSVASTVWLVVTVGLMLFFAAVYVRSLRDVRNAHHLRENIFLSGSVPSPVVYGIFRPRILLPENCDEKALPYILHHERTHIRRRDNLWRMVALATACVHWFNPLCWLFLQAFFKQLELACDESILRRLDPREHKAYAGALLTGAEYRSLYASAFGGAKLRTRLGFILSYKKLSVFSLTVLVLFVGLMAYALLTNP